MTLCVPSTGFHSILKSGALAVPIDVSSTNHSAVFTPEGARALKMIFSFSSGIRGSRRKLSPGWGWVMARLSSGDSGVGIGDWGLGMWGHSGECSDGGSRYPFSRAQGRTSGGEDGEDFFYYEFRRAICPRKEPVTAVETHGAVDIIQRFGFCSCDEVFLHHVRAKISREFSREGADGAAGDAGGGWGLGIGDVGIRDVGMWGVGRSILERLP